MTDIKVPKKMLEDESNENADMQNEVILYQLLQRQLGQLSQEAESVERKYVEAAATKESIKELVKPVDLLMPIGSGCYIHGNFSKTTEVLVDIGAGVLLPKTPKQVEEFIAEKEAEMTKLKSDLHSEATKMVDEMNRIAMKARK